LCYEKRRKKWEASVNSVNQHNLLYKSGQESYLQGINQFSDGTKPSMGLLQPEITFN